MQQNIEDLQNLLEQEIIEKNYDQEKFEKFANQRYPDKDELSCWTFYELQQLIKEFQNQQQSITMNQGHENPIQNQQQSNQQRQNQTIQNGSQESVPIIKTSRLIPKKKTYKIFKNTFTKEEAQKSGFNEEQMQVLSKILEERSLMAFDNQIIFQDYQKQIQCQIKQQYIQEDVELKFKITSLIEKRKNTSVFQIETQPFNWKVQRTKEDFKTLERMMQIYLPEYSGYIIQYNEKQKLEIQLENALRIYYGKPKTRSLIYFLLFLNDESSKIFHCQPFSYYSQCENNIKNFNLKQLATSSGFLNIEFNQQNYQNYQNLQELQKTFSQAYLELEKQFQQSLLIINQETQKMKKQLKLFQESIKNIVIQDIYSQNLPESNFNLFLKNMNVFLQISEEIQNFCEMSIFPIKQKLFETIKIIEQPIIKCQEVSENIKKIYLKDFIPTKNKFLSHIDIINFLNQYGIKEKSISDCQYETLSSITRDIFPLQVDINFEYLQDAKDQFAYLIFQVLLEGQNCYQKLFKEINFYSKKNSFILFQEISKIMQV